MASLRERGERWAGVLFPWSWRLAILALPWQTRWFQEGPSIAGYPWEQGRVSVYGSELLMLIVIFLGFFSERSAKSGDAKQKNTASRVMWTMGFGVLVMSFLATASLRSTFEWWLEVLILLGFFWTFIKRVSFSQVAPWLIGSLIPHALLGLWQAIDQRVIGSSLLGIATQDPLTRGVAVIEAGGVRWLRAYGGFSHPNIFGGWLVLGVLVICTRLKQEILRGRERIVYYISLALFSFALVFTYSRSAWIALGLGLSVLAVQYTYSKQAERKVRIVCAIGLIIASMLIGAMLRPQLIRTRTQVGTRLEQKSLSERSHGIQNGLRILRRHPLFGSGLGASALVLTTMDQEEGREQMIPVPPHIVPLLAVAEFGGVGVILMGMFLFFYTCSIKPASQKRSFIAVQAFVPCIFLLPLLFLDHYLWSYWSGKVLISLAFFLCFLDEK